MRSDSSFTKIENDLAPGLRNRVNSAEGVTDVQQAFAAFVQDILSRIVGAAVVLEEGDVRVDPAATDGFALGPGITANKDYARLLENSDLLDILRRQAVQAVNRIGRLGKNTVRTEAKIFQRPDRKF